MKDEFLILVANVGSTSFKFKLFNMYDGVVLASGIFERIGEENSQYQYRGTSGTVCGRLSTVGGYSVAINMALALLQEENFINSPDDIDAVAFKAVMCGEEYHTCFVNKDIINKMEDYAFVAPVHNPPYIAAIKSFAEIIGEKKIIVAFENEFHKSIPDYVRISSINYMLAEKYKIKKYGYHGASHAYIADTVKKIYGDNKKIISCHLGGSSSVCAINDGNSLDISMDFSPQSGLPMSERIGDTDVFSVIYLMEKEELSPKEMREILSYNSGLKGISGISGDMRDLINSSSLRAVLAVKNYVYYVKKYIGAYFALLNGADIISFTGGIGENNSLVRHLVCENLQALGVVLSQEKNEYDNHETITEISEASSATKVIVVPANEELIVAKKAYDLILKRCFG